jgi:hypothetical protein
METFLADYGMVWVGDQEDPEADIYIEDNSTDEVRKARQATGGLQLTDVTETKGQPDFKIDFSRLCENIRDLNIIAGEGKIIACAHMFKTMKLAPFPTCSCGLEDQNPDHILKICPLLKTLRDKPGQQ